MATTYSTNIGFGTPGAGDRGWKATLDANRATLDALGAVGPLAVRAKELPSTSLNVKVAAGTYRDAGGTLVSYAGSTSFALTLSSTNYVYLTDSGTLTNSTSAFPAGNIVRLATVITGVTTVTSVADSRLAWLSLGGHPRWGVGTPTIAAGTGAGTSPTLSVAGSDQGGVITVATGTSPSVSATVATVTFGQAFAVAPRAVILTAGGSNTAALSGNAQVYVDSTATTTTVFVVKVGSTALAASTTYKWHFTVIG